MSLWAEIEETMRLLDLALAESAKRGQAWVQAQAHYYGVKARTVYQMEAEGQSASMIALKIKGEPSVNEAMAARDAAQVEYENAREARNVYKKKLDTLREEYAREWNRAGME